MHTFVSSVLSERQVLSYTPPVVFSASILHVSGVKPNLHNRHDPRANHRKIMIAQHYLVSVHNDTG